MLNNPRKLQLLHTSAIADSSVTRASPLDLIIHVLVSGETA